MYHGERFNAYSHLAGFLLAVAALVLMLVKAVESADGYRIAGALTYGVCLLLLYLGSTLYHSIPQPKAKAILQKVDHCMIYLLIAGSYTPFTLITLHGGWGLVAFRCVVGAGFAGHCAGADDWAQKREAAVVDGDLCVDGLVDCGGGMAADTVAFGRRVVLAGVGAAYCIVRGFIGLSTIRKSATATVSGTCLSWQAV